MHKAVAEVRLQAQLVVVEAHQLAAGEHDQRGAGHRIEQQPECQLGADGPQHHDEAQEGEQCRNDLNADAEAGGGEAGRVLRDPLVGVVDLLRGFVVWIENVIGAVREITAEQSFAQPLTPEQAQLGNQIALQGTDRQCQHQAEGIDGHHLPELISLISNQGVIDIASDIADAHIDAIDHQDQQRDHPHQQPGQPAPLAELAAQRHEAAHAEREESHHHRTGGTGPDGRHLLGHTGQEPRLQIGRETAGQRHRAGQQQQRAAHHHRQQSHDQQQELPTAGVLDRQEVRLGEAPQLAELTAEGLQGVHDGDQMPPFSPAPPRSRVSAGRSARRPGQGTPTDHVHMQVEHCLAGLGAAVDHRAETREALLACHPGRHQQQVAQQLLVLL